MSPDTEADTESDTESALISYTAPVFFQPERAGIQPARAGKKKTGLYTKSEGWKGFGWKQSVAVYEIRGQSM